MRPTIYLSFISKDKPIVFILNNKEKYQVLDEGRSTNTE